MERWAATFSGETQEHPVTCAARAHIDLTAIHPFVDGNGRTARLIVNFLLMQSGYPPALYTMTARRDYLHALEVAHMDGNPLPFIAVTAQAAELMLDRWLFLIEDSRPESGRPGSEAGTPPDLDR